MTPRLRSLGALCPLAFFLLLGSLSACTLPAGHSGSSSPDSPSADDDDDVPTDDDDSVEGPVEENCDDGLDDDEDGQVDCLDSDCDDVFHCTWPDEIEIDTLVEFSANELAKSFGVGDCTLEFGGPLALLDTPAGCELCDREYEGSVSVAAGDCPQEYIEPPTYGLYGFVFVAPGERELWKFDTDDELWLNLGPVESSGSNWQLEHTSPVLYDVPIFGETEVGSFTVHESLTDL